METLQIEIINPKALKLLMGLMELDLISIKKTPTKDLTTGLKPHKSKTGEVFPEIYPYKPQYLKFQDANYILGEKLDCKVGFTEGQYTITNELLDIAVWADTRDKAEEAFAFAFHAVYENFGKEDDANLTDKAKVLKGQLNRLVVNIVNDYEG